MRLFHLPCLSLTIFNERGKSTEKRLCRGAYKKTGDYGRGTFLTPRPLPPHVTLPSLFCHFTEGDLCGGENKHEWSSYVLISLSQATAVKRTTCVQFPPKLLFTNASNFGNPPPSSQKQPKVKTVSETVSFVRRIWTGNLIIVMCWKYGSFWLTTAK